jgi:hypothetical protein
MPDNRDGKVHPVPATELLDLDLVLTARRHFDYRFHWRHLGQRQSACDLFPNFLNLICHPPLDPFSRERHDYLR